MKRLKVCFACFLTLLLSVGLLSSICLADTEEDESFEGTCAVLEEESTSDERLASYIDEQLFGSCSLESNIHSRDNLTGPEKAM